MDIFQVTLLKNFFIEMLKGGNDLLIELPGTEEGHRLVACFGKDFSIREVSISDDL